MIDRVPQQVKYDNHFQLLCMLSPQVLGMSAFDQQGELLWQGSVANSDAESKIQAYVRNNPIKWRNSKNGIDKHRLESGEAVHHCCLQDAMEKSILTLVILTDESEARESTPQLALNDALYTLANGMQTELSLQQELALRDEELSTMADELTERYEELNLVYAADKQVHEFSHGQDSLQRLVANCTEFLNVGMTALIIPEKHIDIHDFNQVDPIPNPSTLLASLRKDIFSRLQVQGRSMVINSISEAVSYQVFSETPHKLIISPVVTGEQAVIGMLVIINHVRRADFTNSDRNLLDVMAKKVLKIIQANFDDLTGLQNDHSFEWSLAEALSTAHSQGTQHAILNFDLDGTKVINDVSGRKAGDALINLVGKTISRRVRGHDVVARIGGDEFGVLLENCPLDTASKLAENIGREIKKLSFEWEGDKHEIGACIGVAPITSESESVAVILSSVEVARNAAKERGRNQIRVYQQNDIDLLRRRDEMKWIGRVQAALREDRFKLFSQLIGSLKPGLESHYEILLRMNDEQGELVFPGQFMPAAEHYNLMPGIDRWVIEQTISQLLEASDPQQEPPCHVAINLSGQSLCDSGFQEFVCAQLERLGQYANHICFEITESAAIANLQEASLLISTVKETGVKFSLDDFGTGLSSFAYLQNLEVDYLKIDGSFVRKIETDSIAQTMVSAINQVGHAMGLHTVAEYVENEAILLRLRELGVDYAQGYCLAKPGLFQLQLEEIAGRLKASSV